MGKVSVEQRIQAAHQTPQRNSILWYSQFYHHLVYHKKI